MKQDNLQRGSFTRGSQVFMHNLRMIMQGIKVSLVISGILSVIWIIVRSFRIVRLTDLYYFVVERWALFKLDFGSSFYNICDITIEFYNFAQGAMEHMSALEFRRSFFKTDIAYRLSRFLHWLLSSAWLEFIIVFGICFLLCCFFFIIKGRKVASSKDSRGMDITSRKDLARILKKAKKASDIIIGGLPLARATERQHILVTGTTGSGKTNLLHELIGQIKKRGDRAIIIDANGTFTGSYYQQEKDHLLNPFDKRTKRWLPWTDCRQIYDYDAMAGAIVGDRNHGEKFWEDTTRQVLSCALRKSSNDKSISKLLDILVRSSSTDYASFFAGTDVASLTSEKADKTASSIRSSLCSKITPFNFLEGDEKIFSIRDYILSDDSGWLYISSLPSHRSALSSLTSSWIEMILISLMHRDPSKKNENLWIIIDELGSFGRIPSLKLALSESRKYGGCIVAGMQNINQVMETYNHSGGLDLLDQFSTRYIFRAGDNKTARNTSDILGEKQYIEAQESVSYGANSIRDGVNINMIDKKRPLVLASEIMSLPDLSCYVRLSGNWPITRLDMKYHNIKSISESFIGKKNS